MKKNGVLIIEDDQADYKRIKYNLLPSNCYSLLDSRRKNKNFDLSKEEIKANGIFKEKEETSLKKSEKYVEEIIRKNQDSLRLIICDLQINGNDEGGTQLIKAIKNIDGNNWFAQQIPILILSKMTKKMPNAVRESIGRCLCFTKRTAYESIDILKDVITYMVTDFDGKCKKKKYEKPYKVALSFTGSTTNEKGEKVYLRGFIEDIARELYSKYGEDKVYYDVDKTPKTSSREPQELAQFYNKSEFIVVFLSMNYVDKVSNWAREEWEVIKKLVTEKRVLFMKLDSRVKSDDFEKKLGIPELIYTDLTQYFLKYNLITEGKLDIYREFLFDIYQKNPLGTIPKQAIKMYKELLRNEVAQAAKDITDIISAFIEERE